MQLQLQDNLLFTQIKIAYRKTVLEINHVLIDTGSASTIIAAELVESIDIYPEPTDKLHIIRGVGGSEVVFVKQLDYLQLGEQRIEHFKVEIGAMDYGFTINAILGLDFLLSTYAVLDLGKMQIRFE